MSVFTNFLKLIKPQNHEYYNVEHFNHNSELIDKKMEEHDIALTTIQQGATNTQKGIVQFGIEEGKALEGNMLARLAGAYGFGGDIQTPGVKNQNYIYYDNNTRKMYKCLNQNSDTSANVQNYVPIDNFSFLERLENLFNYQKLQNWFAFNGNASAEIFKVSTLKIIKITLETLKSDTSVNVIFPETFSETPFVTVVDNETNANTTAYTRVAIDWVKKDSVLLKGLDRGFTMLVIGKG